MFAWDHYVPVVRWKAAERDALLRLEPNTHENMTPLIEMVPRFSHLESAEEPLRVGRSPKILLDWNRDAG